jgi:hypothetical protein
MEKTISTMMKKKAKKMSITMTKKKELVGRMWKKKEKQMMKPMKKAH